MVCILLQTERTSCLKSGTFVRCLTTQVLWIVNLWDERGASITEDKTTRSTINRQSIQMIDHCLRLRVTACCQPWSDVNSLLLKQLDKDMSTLAPQMVECIFMIYLRVTPPWLCHKQDRLQDLTSQVITINDTIAAVHLVVMSHGILTSQWLPPLLSTKVSRFGPFRIRIRKSKTWEQVKCKKRSKTMPNRPRLLTLAMSPTTAMKATKLLISRTRRNLK